MEVIKGNPKEVAKDTLEERFDSEEIHANLKAIEEGNFVVLVNSNEILVDHNVIKGAYFRQVATVHILMAE